MLTSHRQNFEDGFFDEQLDRLVQVLKLKRIWWVKIGEIDSRASLATTAKMWVRNRVRAPPAQVPERRGELPHDYLGGALTAGWLHTPSVRGCHEAGCQSCVQHVSRQSERHGRNGW